MIPESAIPTGWQVLEKSDDPIVSFDEENFARLDFYFSNDSKQLTRGGIDLFQHKSLQSATKHYEQELEVVSNPHNPRFNTPLFIPEGFQFSSMGADEWHFSCAGREESFISARVICIYLARYDNYVAMVPITTTYEFKPTVGTADLQKLIETIDAQIVMGLQK